MGTVQEVEAEGGAVPPLTRRLPLHFRLTVIPTGRLAAHDPNVLAIPKHSHWGKRIRESVIAPLGFRFAGWDYSQLEMRIMAHLSQDAGLLKAYRKGVDIHAQTAQNIFGVKPEDQDESLHRLPAKTTGFGILMGIHAYGLYEQLAKYVREQERLGKTVKRWSEEDCARFIKVWLSMYPGVPRYQQQQKREVEETGIIRDFYGRRFLLPQVWCANWKIAEHARRQAIAFPIQSGAQVIVKRAEAAIPDALFTSRVFPVLQVHDDFCFEVRTCTIRAWDTRLRQIMCETTTLSVPLEAEGKAGRCWAQMEKIA